MKEILLCKYGEIVLKGLNKGSFEKALRREMEKRLSQAGPFTVSSCQSLLYAEPQSDDVDMDEALKLACTVFGIVSVSRAAIVEKNLDAILDAVRTYVPRFIDSSVRTFKADAKRSDKHFPMTSPEIAGEVGAAVLETMPRLRVNLDQPDIKVVAEIRENAAYVHAGAFKGAGGMPTGSNGRALLLLSGGIDSPVAGYMMAKRGVMLDALHFESYPYTSEQAREKVLTLAQLVSRYCGRIYVHSISLTHLQEALRDACEEDYFTLLLRRSMMRIAEKLADRFESQAIITGESLGQVASQTIGALNVTNEIATRPVFRPCIGMDKSEIIKISRDIDAFETSILPYEDCCTVFTPKHPKTKPSLEEVENAEKSIDLDSMIKSATDNLRFILID